MSTPQIPPLAGMTPLGLPETYDDHEEIQLEPWTSAEDIAGRVYDALWLMLDGIDGIGGAQAGKAAGDASRAVESVLKAEVTP